MKADDTYLQLKKDLEYLDLKVSAGRSVASVDSLHLGVPPSASMHPGLTQPGSPKKVLLCEPEFFFFLAPTTLGSPLLPMNSAAQA